MKPHMAAPCENCPYRKDAPRRMWHRKEFESVLQAEQSELGSTFACHKHANLAKKKRGFCAGWLLDQVKRGLPSIQLRLYLITHPEAVAALDEVSDGGHEMFATVEEMCRANGVRSFPRKVEGELALIRSRK